MKRVVEMAVKSSFKDGEIIESQVVKFVKLFKDQPASDAIILLSQYLKEVKRIKMSTTLYIESATPLSGDDMSQIKRALSSEYVILNSEFQLNPNLLGGVRVSIGDHIFEDSIMSRIMQIKEAITN